MLRQSLTAVSGKNSLSICWIHQSLQRVEVWRIQQPYIKVCQPFLYIIMIFLMMNMMFTTLPSHREAINIPVRVFTYIRGVKFLWFEQVRQFRGFTFSWSHYVYGFYGLSVPLWSEPYPKMLLSFVDDTWLAITLIYKENFWYLLWYSPLFFPLLELTLLETSLITTGDCKPDFKALPFAAGRKKGKREISHSCDGTRVSHVLIAK